MYTLYKPYRANSYKNNYLLLVHTVVTEEGFEDTEASDRNSEASDRNSEASEHDTDTSDRELEEIIRDTEASDQDPESSDASYLQPGPARQYDDGGKVALATVVIDVDVFAIVVVVAGTVHNDLRHGPQGGRISISIRRRRPRSAANSVAQ